MESDLSEQNMLSCNETLDYLQRFVDKKSIYSETHLRSVLYWLKALTETEDAVPSPQPSTPDTPTEPSIPMTLQIAVPKWPHCVKVEPSKDGSSVSVSWHSASTER